LTAFLVIYVGWTQSAFSAPQAWRALDPANTLVIDTSKGRIVVEMYPRIAPLAVARIKQLTHEHLYDGLLFHRVIDRYVDQTGNPNNKDGGVSSHPNLPPEFRFSLPGAQADSIATSSVDGVTGFISTMPFAATPDPAHPGLYRAWGAYCAGTAGMGRQADPGSANSEVFFMRAPSRVLDHDYTPWGRVVQGENIVQGITVGEPPAHPDRMVKVRVMADMTPAEAPHIDIMNTASTSFADRVATARRAHGADFSVCDITIPTRPSPTR
jgi:peptidylprolyl isomerase